MSDGTLSSLLVHWSEAYNEGRDIPAAELCRDHPDLAGRLAGLIDDLKWMKRFEDDGESDPLPRIEDGGPAAEPPSVLKPGDEPYEGYTLIERLGRGAFGEVWLARRMEVDCALKIVRGGAHLRIEKEGLRRIIDCRHPNVLRRYFHRVWRGTLLVVMELAESSLDKHFARLRPDRPLASLCAEAIWRLRDAADALDYLADEKKLTHLDIKPSNLLLVRKCATDWGRCKLADFCTVQPFGVSEAAEIFVTAPDEARPDDIATVPYQRLEVVPPTVVFRPGATLYTGGTAWTPHYAAPERFNGQFSRSSDQYSLALTFCELVAGRIPFQSTREEQLAARNDGIMTLDFLPSALAPPLRRALSPRREDRFPTCLDFVAAMREALLANVEDAEARSFLSDVRDGGLWPEARAGSWPDRPSLPVSEVRDPRSCEPPPGKHTERTTVVVPRWRRLPAAAMARVLARVYGGVRLFDRLASWCWRARGSPWAAPATGRWAVAIVLMVLAGFPVAILVERIEGIATLLVPWTGDGRPPGFPQSGAAPVLSSHRDQD